LDVEAVVSIMGRPGGVHHQLSRRSCRALPHAESRGSIVEDSGSSGSTMKHAKKNEFS
jgi:hypothetical protein